MEYNNFTINELITDVISDFLFLYGGEFENIPGKEITRGIRLFNELISLNNIPILWRAYTNTISGQAVYTALDIGAIPGFREVQAVHILINDNWYPLKEISQSEADRNISSPILPGLSSPQGKPIYYLYNKAPTHNIEERDENSSIILYPTPDSNYSMKVSCRLSQFLIENQDNVTEKLSVTPEWIPFLRYGLARMIKDYHTKAKWTKEMEIEYQRLSGIVAWKYNDDTATKTDSALTNQWGWGYNRRGFY